jgi:hypothetical protein
LRLARRAGVLGSADATLQPDRARRFVQGNRRRAELVAEQRRDTLVAGLRFQVPARAAVVLE